MTGSRNLARLAPFLLVMASLFSLTPLPTSAQGNDACPTIVLTAVEAAHDGCQTMGRNQICYGHAQVQAVDQDGAPDASFRQPGDIREVLGLQTIQTAPLNEALGQWGIALLRIQANLPETLPGQNVTVVLFGDVTFSDESGAETSAPTIVVTATGNVNLRAGPSTGHSIVGSLAAGDSALAEGRLEDGSWLRLRLEDGIAWVYSPLVSADGDVNSLRVVAGDSPTYGPMQAFTFSAGLGDAPCAQAPESGLLIQTPEGAGQVTLAFNGVEIVLGSTVVLQGGPQTGDLVLAQLEGTGMLPGVGDTLLGGQAWTFGMQAGQWTPAGVPQPLDTGRYAYLPLDLLPRPITLYERQVISSGAYDVVTRYFPPPPDVPAGGPAAILVHGRALDWTSWAWLIPLLHAQGWGVLVPDMPGHGETGGQPNYGDWAGIIGDLAGYAQTRGHGTGVIVGASIGANSGAVACANLADWCQGAALFSPGIDYFGVQTLPVMPALGARPVLIITSENDERGGPGEVARQIAAAGDNIMLQIYDGNLHGTFLADQYDLLEPIAAWLSQFPTD